MDLKTVELFAGIGGFRMAADRIGLKTIWANDFNSDACDVYAKNFGRDSIICGDINNLLEEVPQHDLLTAGFPCQPFSSAGKKKGIFDARGTLFEVVVSTLKTHKPKYFVLENVKRLISMQQGMHFATILSALAELNYLIEWRVVNASNLGLPQNRERIVIVGRRSDVWRGEVRENLILIDNTEFKELSEKSIKELMDNESWDNILDHSTAFKKWGVAYKNKFFDQNFIGFHDDCGELLLKNILEEKVDDIFDLTDATIPRLKRNTVVNKFVNGVQIYSNQRGGARMGYTIFGVEGLSPTLTASTSRHYERYKIGDVYRRLTNIEYARLQGFPDDHCSILPFRDQYVRYGNAIPPNIAEWALRKLLFAAPVRLHKSIKMKEQLNLLTHA